MQQIADAQANGVGTVCYRARRGEVDFEYMVDLRSMRQINQQTGASRNIRQVVRRMEEVMGLEVGEAHLQGAVGGVAGYGGPAAAGRCEPVLAIAPQLPAPAHLWELELDEGA